MLKYILRRMLMWIPSILFVMFAVYALAFYGAGDPIKLIFLRAPGDVAYDPVRIEAIRHAAGLDRPFLVQFLHYLGNLLQGDWGNSLITGRPVWRMIVAAAPVSVQLGLLAIVVTAILGISLGVVAGMNRNTRIDYGILGTALVIWAIPPYVAGPLLMVSLLLILPTSDIPYGWGGVFDVRVFLPLLVLSMQPIALIIRQTRTAIIDIATDDFVRTARAKGVPESVVIFRHILRPALVPVITQLGLILISLVNGAVFVELVFGLPGLGRLTVASMLDSDYPVILAVTLIGAAMVMISNLVVDVVYPLLDPRAAQPAESQ